MQEQMKVESGTLSVKKFNDMKKSNRSKPKKIFGRCQKPCIKAKKWSRYSQSNKRNRRAKQTAAETEIETAVKQCLGQGIKDTRHTQKQAKEEQYPREGSTNSSPKEPQCKNPKPRTWSRRTWLPRKSRRCQQRRAGKRRKENLASQARQDYLFHNTFAQKTHSFRKKPSNMKASLQTHQNQHGKT